MNIDLLNIQVSLKDKHTLIKILLFLKFMEKGIKLTDNELGVLAILSKTENKSEAIKIALENKYVKSVQSGDNFISKMVNMGLIEKVGSGVRRVSSEFLPSLPSDLIAATVKIHNLATG